METVRTAIERLDASPLYGLVRQHIVRLVRDLDRVEEGPSSTMLGGATAELARALVCSVAGSPPLARDALEHSLRRRVEVYVMHELGDPGLCPGQIAKKHDISVRRLYGLWAAEELSPAEWIMSERLELARRELASPATGSRTIAAIAHACGFVDAAHFARRFRAAYGVSPREWRQMRTGAV
jgi:AraC-like DNA-binding protein